MLWCDTRASAAAGLTQITSILVYLLLQVFIQKTFRHRTICFRHWPLQRWTSLIDHNRCVLIPRHENFGFPPTPMRHFDKSLGKYYLCFMRCHKERCNFNSYKWQCSHKPCENEYEIGFTYFYMKSFWKIVLPEGDNRSADGQNAWQESSLVITT